MVPRGCPWEGITGRFGGLLRNLKARRLDTAQNRRAMDGSGQTEEQKGGQTIARAAGSISAWTLVSRVLGLIRDMLTTHALGRGVVFDSFSVAWMLPNMLRRLFGEGALHAAFVPEYSRRLEQEGPQAARRLLAAVSGGLGAVLAVVTLCVVVGSLVARSSAEDPLLPELLATLFPYCVPICLVAVYAGALNVLGSFARPAAVPVLLNVVWILALVVAVLSEAPERTIARNVSFALLAGGLIQLGSLISPLRRRGQLVVPKLPRRGDGSGIVFRRMLPAALGLSVAQLNLIVDQSLAYFFLEEGANTSLYLSQRLLLFPHALIAIPLATAVFPALSRDASRQDLTALQSRHRQSLDVLWFLAVPSAVGLALVSEPLLAVAFEHGRFEADDTLATAAVTTALALGLPALGAVSVAARGLYALGRTDWPARIAVLAALVNVTFDLVLVFVFDLGTPGLAIATSLAAYTNAFGCNLALAKLSGRTPPGTGMLRAALSAAVMAAVLLSYGEFLSDRESTRTVRALRDLIAPIVLGALSYGGMQLVLKSPELAWLKQKLTRSGRTR